MAQFHLTATDLFHLAVKEKGRTVLPVGLQRACGFAPGASLVARPLGMGQFIVETSEAVLERIWSRGPAAGPVDAVEDLDDWRRESETGRRRELEAEIPATTEDSERRGAVLLRRLGLG